jgi:aminoglycoside-2''-adenylyltransferase
MAAIPALDAWLPLSVAEANGKFSRLNISWWVAGGWAIDLFLGAQTREHRDIDISVLRADIGALQRIGDEFEFFVAHEGEVYPWDGSPLADRHHQFWARSRQRDAWAFEVLVEQHRDDRWMFRRTHEISLPLHGFGLVNTDDIPFVSPAVALLYKANRHEIDRNAADFAKASPRLDDDSRLWLRWALETAHGSHPWLDALNR